MAGGTCRSAAGDVLAGRRRERKAWVSSQRAISALVRSLEGVKQGYFLDLHFRRRVALPCRLEVGICSVEFPSTSYQSPCSSQGQGSPFLSNSETQNWHCQGLMDDKSRRIGDFQCWCKEFTYSIWPSAFYKAGTQINAC